MTPRIGNASLCGEMTVPDAQRRSLHRFMGAPSDIDN